MDQQAIESLGGICQLLGVVIVVRDLLALHGYMGDLGRLWTRLRDRRNQVVGVLRRMLRRPGRDVIIEALTATARATIFAPTIRVTPGPFHDQLDQPVQGRSTAQADYVNRLRDWMLQEVEQHDQLLEEERLRARAELQAERARLDRVIADAQRVVDKLRKFTTSGAGSRWAGVFLLLVGIICSTWPDNLAAHWPAWASAAVVWFVGLCAAAAWFFWRVLAQLQADTPRLAFRWFGWNRSGGRRYPGYEEETQ